MAIFGPPDIEKLTVSKNLSALIKALAYPDDSAVRVRAAEALGRLRAREAVAALAEAVEQGQDGLRSAAAEALARIRDPSAVPALVDALNGAPPGERPPLIRALVALGGAAGADAIAWIRDTDPENRRMAVQGLARLEDLRAVAPLGAAPTPRTESLRRDTFSALKPVARRVAHMVAAELAVAEDRRALLELAVIAGEAAVDPLKDLLAEENGPLREDVIAALARIDVPSALAAVESALDGGDVDLCRSALAGVAASGHPRRGKWIARKLEDDSLSVRAEALKAAGVARDPGVIPVLTRLAEAADRDTGEPIIRAMEAVGGKESVAGFGRLLAAADAPCRRPAADALGRVSSTEANEVLSRFSADPDLDIRLSSLAALMKIDPRRAGRGLIEAVQLPDAGADQRREAARLLRRMNWRPRSERLQAWYCVAEGRWADLEALGEAAREALVTGLGDRALRRDAARELDRLGWRPAPADPHALDFWIETGRVEEMARFGEKIHPMLIDRLERSEGEACRVIADALGRIGYPGTTDALLRRLSSLPANQGNVAAGAAMVRALGRTRGEKMEGRLEAAIEGDANRAGWGIAQYPAVRFAAVEAVAYAGLPAVEKLLQVCGTGDATLGAKAEEELGRICDDRGQACIPKLLPALKATDRSLRERVSRLLIRVYRSGGIDDRGRRMILDQEGLLVGGHQDITTGQDHQDGQGTVEGWCKSHVDIPSTLVHTDQASPAKIGSEDSLLVHFDPVGSPSSAASEPGDAEMDAALSSDPLERGRAALRLGRLKAPKAADRLVHLLADASWRVRAVAARALGEIADSKSMEPLMERVRTDSTLRVRTEAIAALGRIGEERAVDFLVKTLGDDTWQIRQESAATLAKIGRQPDHGPARSAFFSCLLEQVDPGARMDAVARLADSKDPALKGLWSKPLSDPEPEVRLAAVSAVGGLGGMVGPSPILPLLQDPAPEVRAGVVAALRSLNWRPTVPTPELIPYFLHTGGWQSCLRFGRKELPRLERAIDEDGPEARASAIRAMAAMAGPGAVDRLGTLLERDESPLVCRAIVEGLAEIKTDRALHLLWEVHAAAYDLSRELGRVPVDRAAFKLDPGSGEGILFPRRRAAAGDLGGDSDGRSAVVGEIRRELDHLCSVAVSAFNASGRRGADVLITLLTGTPGISAKAVFTFIGALEGALGGSILVRALKIDRHREEAASALIRCKESIQVSQLTPLLSFRGKPETRAAAARILDAWNWVPRTAEEIADFALFRRDWAACRSRPDTVPALIRMLQANLPDGDLRAIAGTLAVIGGQGVVSGFQAVIRNGPFPAKLAVVKALPALGGKSAVSVAVDALRLGSASVALRNAAVGVLRQVHGSGDAELRNHILRIHQTTLRHQDTAAGRHQDSRTKLPSHKDYGGLKCINDHTDIGGHHRDVPGRPHRDVGIKIDFSL